MMANQKTAQEPTRRSSLVLEVEGQRLLAVLHRPTAKGEKRPAAALFHGLVGSKDQPHRMLVKLADRLAAAGAVALRVDFRGRGESDGDALDITPARDLADASRAVFALAAQPDVDPNRLGLVGLSWGAAVAALVAGRDTRIASTVLISWAPGDAPWQPELRDVDGRVAADVDGNLIGEPFFVEAARLRPLEELKRTRGAVLLLHGAADQATPAERVRAAAQALAQPGRRCESVAITGADHAFMRYEWETAAIERAMGWLRETLLNG